MPKFVGETVRPISFTLSERQIVGLDALCEAKECNRSEWLRQQINVALLSHNIEQGEEHNHLPVNVDLLGKHAKWWSKMGKDNPNPAGRAVCVTCWPEGPPKKSVRWGKTVWTLPDGSEVVE